MRLLQTLALGLALLALASLPVRADGPRCTVEYPRGFKVAKSTKKHPAMRTCTNGIFGETWGVCVSRYRT